MQPASKAWASHNLQRNFCTLKTCRSRSLGREKKNATGASELWALMGKSFDIPLAQHQGPTSAHITQRSSDSTMWLHQNSPLNWLRWPPQLPITLVLLFDPKLHLTAGDLWHFTLNQAYRLTQGVRLHLASDAPTLPCRAAALHCQINHRVWGFVSYHLTGETILCPQPGCHLHRPPKPVSYRQSMGYFFDVDTARKECSLLILNVSLWGKCHPVIVLNVHDVQSSIALCKSLTLWCILFHELVHPTRHQRFCVCSLRLGLGPAPTPHRRPSPKKEKKLLCSIFNYVFKKSKSRQLSEADRKLLILLSEYIDPYTLTALHHWDVCHHNNLYLILLKSLCFQR